MKEKFKGMKRNDTKARFTGDDRRVNVAELLTALLVSQGT